MSAPESPRMSGLVELIGALLCIVVIACPLAVLFAVPAAAWARRHEHDSGLLWRVGLTAAMLASLAALLTMAWYGPAWRELVSDVASLHVVVRLVGAVALMLPTGIPGGIAVGIGAERAWQQQRERHPLHGREARAQRQERVRRLRANEASAHPLVPVAVAGCPVLGAWLEGDNPPEWVRGPWSVIPDDVFHIVALGATGAGKTVSILRLAAAHLALGWRVFVIDAKEEHDSALAFARYASAAGVSEARCRIWPDSGAMDLCRGSGQALRDRLMASASWSEAFYRAVAATVLTLVCDDRGGPPAALSQVLGLMDTHVLRTRWAGTDRATVAAGLDAKLIQGLRYRYFSLFSDLEAIGAVRPNGGGWSWEDVDAAWITLPTSTRLEIAGSFGRALLVDLIGYLRDITRRTDRRPILLVVEEMGAIVQADPIMANFVIDTFERARSAAVRCIVSAQTPEGLGQTDAQARLLHGGAAVLAHRMANPEPIVSLLGTRMGLEASLGVTASGELLESGSLREQHQWQVAPDVMRRLPVGHALFAHAGRWSLTAVARLPDAPSLKAWEPPDAREPGPFSAVTFVRRRLDSARSRCQPKAGWRRKKVNDHEKQTRRTARQADREHRRTCEF